MSTATHRPATRHISGFVLTPRDLCEVLGDAIGRRPSPEEKRGFQSYFNTRLPALLEAHAAMYAAHYI